MADGYHDRAVLTIGVQERTSDGTFANGHVETVTSVDYHSSSVTTNSWGTQATVTGGSAGNFNHSRDGSVGGQPNAFHNPDGSKLWPADSTAVWIQTACPCGQFGTAASFFASATL